MASGMSKVVRGSFLGTGAAINIRSVGFRPRSVHIWNLSGLATGVWLEGMADASAFKEVTAGTKSLVTSDGITPLSDGFTLGADTDLNVSGELVRFEAIE
jgi:hypothetical protein